MTSEVELCGDYGGYSRAMSALGRRGLLTLQWDPTLARGEARGSWSLSGPGQGLGRSEPFDLDATYRAELAHFLGCAAAGQATAVPFADGLAVLRIMDRAREVTT